MKILLAASEFEPFASTGAFGANVTALATELAAQGHDVSVALPFYRSVRENRGVKAKRTNVRFSVPVGAGRYSCEIREVRSKGVQVFFVERDEFFDRSGLYGTEDGDYQDNAARFIFFSKCVVELARRMDPEPEILQAHNWQAALVPVFASHQRLPMRSVLVADSLDYQGNFWSYDFGLTNLPADLFSPRGLEYFGSMNLLKGGILFADRVALPGSRFVSEAQTVEHGCGLDPVMREQTRKLEGIAHGLDVSSWNPANDAALAKGYRSAQGKAQNRAAWLKEAAIEEGSMHLLVVTDAMTGDGMETLLPSIDRLLESGVRIAVLGKVEPSNVGEMEFAIRKHAGRFAWIPDSNEKTLRLALAGSDVLLAPAPIRPDAFILRLALRYGVLPVPLQCGGLVQLAPPFRVGEPSGLAFTFYRNTPDALVDAVRRARSVHRDREVWSETVNRAMALDFSWAATAHQFSMLYSSMLARGAMAA